MTNRRIVTLNAASLPSVRRLNLLKTFLYGASASALSTPFGVTMAEDKTTCEYWAVSTILERGDSETLSATFEVANGANRISPQGIYPVNVVKGLLGV